MKTLFAWSLVLAVALCGASRLLGDDNPKEKPKEGQKDSPKEKGKDGDKPKDNPKDKSKDGDKPKDHPKEKQKDGDKPKEKPKGGDQAKIKQAPSPEDQFKRLDTNGDGKLTAEEFIDAQVAAIKQKALAMIKSKDANNDGSVSLDEFKAEPAKVKKEGKPAEKNKGDQKPIEKPKDKG